MLQLFLCQPAWDHDTRNDEYSKQRISLLDELEQSIWSFISSGSRSEARLWLCNTISSINSIRPRHQRDLFLSLLRSKPIKRNLASQLLQLIFQKQPQKVGPIIARKSCKLENFFKGNSRRILQWFSNFAGTSGSDHGQGAKALSQFAFVNRDICWEELEWKGKHGQSPAMVATKPHYFLDLDVLRTVDNFLEYVPEFWSSREFSESLKDGSILLIDTQYFVDLFTDLMYEEDLEEVWEVIDEFLMEQSFSFLCHHLLIILEEQDLCHFLDLVPKYLRQKSEIVGLGSASEWFEAILSKYSASTTIDQLLLLIAVTSQGRHLLRLVQEEGSEEQKQKIKDVVSQLCELSNHANDLEAILKEGLNSNPLVVIKSNGIKFRQSDKYAMLHDDDFPEDGSDYDRGSRVSLKRKKHRKHKRRHRNINPTEDYEDELVGHDILNNRLDLQSKVGDWLLSTDGYSSVWSSVDLPEHLSRHCFIVWLKWMFAKSEMVP
ncbi:uncharacterized protein LOC125190961 isoform X2 [Salvia hispanica]|uniref:uncharacterized protein LOC125190961 isoform X2 n=1 Tax=Salvia hispanica TaxID=49212 RepID=UPI002008F471|nr:uncharacterized protein LOC125190961 isoform X2 [Salvia hispanica]